MMSQITEAIGFSKKLSQSGWKRIVFQTLVVFIVVDLLVFAVIWPLWPTNWQYSTNWGWINGTKISIHTYNTNSVMLLGKLVTVTKHLEELKGNQTNLELRYAETLFYEITANLSRTDFHQHSSHNTNQSLIRGLHYFRPKMTVAEMKILLDLLKIFHKVTTEAGLFYIMCAGTLLGSYRFHGFIPWDDDADVYALFSERLKLLRALEKLPPSYKLFSYHSSGKAKATSTRWKVYNNESGQTIKGVQWKFPFLDISFLRQNSTHLWDQDPNFKKRFMYQNSQIYPVTRRPYMSLQLNAPSDTESVLRKTYQLTNCTTNSYDHKKERPIAERNKRSLLCKKLQGIYPIVTHSKTLTGVNETLKYKDQIIYSILL